MNKIDETTYYIDDEFVRCFLLVGEEKALWIDTGVSGLDLVAIAGEVTELPVMVVNTHGDGDHLASNKLFSEYMMTEADYNCCSMAEKCPESKCIFVKDGDVIELGNRPVTVWEVPGHTRGSIALFEADRRRLYSGDTVQTERVFMFGPHRDADNFAATLEALTRKSDLYDEIYASHGTLVLKPDHIDKQADFWQKVLKGEVEGTEEDFFGNTVTSYQGDECGFLM